MSNSSRSVSIVLWVSYLSCSEFSICVLSSFLNFLLSSSSCLYRSAFRKMFSLFDCEGTSRCSDSFSLVGLAKSFRISPRKFLISSTYYSKAS